MLSYSLANLRILGLDFKVLLIFLCAHRGMAHKIDDWQMGFMQKLDASAKIICLVLAATMFFLSALIERLAEFR
jgi:hypothetical protein